MKPSLKRFLALSVCLFLLCGTLPANAQQTVTTVTHYTVPSYFAPVEVNIVIAGDINGDRKVNNKDLTRLFLHLTGWDVDYVEEALDVNGDNRVNNKDLTRLFKYLSGWDVQVFPPCEHTGGAVTCDKRAICEICGQEYGEPALGHDYGATVTPPTCTKQGYTTHTCSRCGDSYADDYTAATGHSGGTATYYQKALCDVCGEGYGNYTQMLAYDQLNDNQKDIYEVLNTAVLNLDKSDIYLENYIDDLNTGESDINVAFRALSYDKPDYFWMPRSYYLGKGFNKKTGELIRIYISFDKDGSEYGEYHVSEAQRTQMRYELEQKISKIVAGTTACKTNFDKEVYIHDYLCKNVVYNYDAANSANGNSDYEAFTAYGALVLGTCVCEGYSRAMQLICQRIGIPCGLATGVYYTENQDEPGTYFATLHMWNIINPGDGCYYLDVTFDDLDFDVFPFWHVYFNLSYEETAIDHVFDSAYVPGNDYSDVNSEFNFFDCFGDRYNLGYYTNSHAYILKDDASGAADYLVLAKARGQTHADIFFDANSLTAFNAIQLLNKALSGKIGTIRDYVYIDNYIYLQIPN